MLAIEKPVSRRRSPNRDCGVFHGAALWSASAGGVDRSTWDSGVCPGRSARNTPKEVSTTPVSTLFAEPASASTCCSTLPRKLDCAIRGDPASEPGREMGIGVSSAVLEEDEDVSICQHYGEDRYNG